MTGTGPEDDERGEEEEHFLADRKDEPFGPDAQEKQGDDPASGGS